MIRTTSYPTEDGLNFAGINFPTPVSQIDKLEKQNPNLAINVFGWEKGKGTVCIRARWPIRPELIPVSVA